MSRNDHKPSTAKKSYSFRLDADLAIYIKMYASQVGVSQATVIETFIQSLQDGRLFVTPDERPDPFPGVTRAELLPVRPFNSPVQPGTYPHRAGQAVAQEESS